MNLQKLFKQQEKMYGWAKGEGAMRHKYTLHEMAEDNPRMCLRCDKIGKVRAYPNVLGANRLCPSCKKFVDKWR